MMAPWLLTLLLTLATSGAEAAPCAARWVQDTVAAAARWEVGGPPVGELRPLASKAGELFQDQGGRLWTLKTDATSAELETAAEVVSSWVYRHFGYFAPEAYIVEMNGQRLAATRWIEGGKPVSLLTDLPDTAENRGLSIVAAFLGDDRLSSTNNLRLADGSLVLRDFRGSLAAGTAQIYPGVQNPALSLLLMDKPEEAVRKAISEAYPKFNLDRAPDNHPWRKITKDDARKIHDGLRELDTRTIVEIVERARYSPQNRTKVTQALLDRRDVLYDWLGGHLGFDEPVFATRSYWSAKTKLPELTFDVDPTCADKTAGEALRRFTQARESKPGHLLLFRGQAELTDKLLSPGLRETAAPGTSLSNPNNPINPISMDKHYRDNLIYRREVERRKARDLVPVAMSAGLSKDEAYRNATWWDKASLADVRIDMHTRTSGDPLIVSATRSLRVATRTTVINRAAPIQYRYVYVLEVPKERILPVYGSLSQSHNSRYLNEFEYSVLEDATPYVLGVYDTFERRFVK